MIDDKIRNENKEKMKMKKESILKHPLTVPILMLLIVGAFTFYVNSKSIDLLHQEKLKNINTKIDTNSKNIGKITKNMNALALSMAKIESNYGHIKDQLNILIENKYANYITPKKDLIL